MRTFKDGFKNDQLRNELLKLKVKDVRGKLSDAADAVDEMDRLLTKPIEPEFGQQLPLFPREMTHGRAE